MFRIGSPLDGFIMRNMTINGGADTVNGDPVATLSILVKSDEATSQSYRFEDLIVENSYGEGFTLRSQGVTVERCTVRKNGKHGINIGATNTDGQRVEIKQTLLENNSRIHPGHYGIDAAYGDWLIEETVITGNRHGMKTVDANDCLLRRVRIANNDKHSFLTTTGDNRGNATVVFDDVVAEDNGRSFRLEDQQNFVVPDGSELVVTNSGAPENQPQIFLINNATIDASNVYSSHARDGVPGITSYTNSTGSTIENYYPYSNSGGATGSTDNLSIHNQATVERTDIDGVPVADEVGAWSGTTDSGDSTEPAPDTTAANITTASGVIQTMGATIQTGAAPTPVRFDTVEDFEGYPTGKEIHTTDPWAGAGWFSTNLAVTSSAAASGDQSVILTDSLYYNAVQSLAGDGLNEYPSADCTIRVATYIEDGFHDIAFGIPSDESNFNENCYRIRGGPEYSGNPIIRRTVDGSSEPLETFDSDFPTNTWLEHVIEFETTSSGVVLTYHGYEWDRTNSEWRSFESSTQGVDPSSVFADDVGVGIGTYRVGGNRIFFDEYRVGPLGKTGRPEWTPAVESP
ncbi:right-handed parallel beta-helix repeat-containing protein [Halovenus marina]|uniref:right-handed parallel beta-helix repeat-containing protein n=1 Tax=Halovenus marina TaxID=3396621 RepID=UPI003F56A0F2